MLISVISVLISSIALLGVAVGLLFQARQLRASQVQAARASQVELLKFAIDNPGMVKAMDGFSDSGTFVNYVIRNWYFTYLSMSYDNRTITKTGLQRVAETVFKDDVTRDYWSQAGYSYSGVATSRREKDFWAIIDNEFQRALRELAATAELDATKADESSPPSS